MHSFNVQLDVQYSSNGSLGQPDRESIGLSDYVENKQHNSDDTVGLLANASKQSSELRLQLCDTARLMSWPTDVQVTRHLPRRQDSKHHILSFGVRNTFKSFLKLSAQQVAREWGMVVSYSDTTETPKTHSF